MCLNPRYFDLHLARVWDLVTGNRVSAGESVAIDAKRGGTVDGEGRGRCRHRTAGEAGLEGVEIVMNRRAGAAGGVGTPVEGAEAGREAHLLAYGTRGKGGQ